MTDDETKKSVHAYRFPMFYLVRVATKKRKCQIIIIDFITVLQWCIHIHILGMYICMYEHRQRSNRNYTLQKKFPIVIDPKTYNSRLNCPGILCTMYSKRLIKVYIYLIYFFSVYIFNIFRFYLYLYIVTFTLQKSL